MDDEKPASETRPAAEVPAPAPRKTLLDVLFNPQTRLGRFNRAALRALAVILSLFALGLVAGYLALYQPALRQINQLQNDLKAARDTGGSLNTDLNAARMQVATLSADKQDLQNSLAKASQHVQVLQVLSQMRAARVALAVNNVSGSRNALLEVRNALITIAPLIDAYRAALSQNVQANFDLALGKLDTDPVAAGAYLDVAINSLADMEKVAFK